MKKTWYYEKMMCLLFISFLIVEGIFHFLTFRTILDKEFLRIILFTLVMSSFFAFLLSFLKEKYSKIIFLFLITFSAVYAIAQLGFYNFMGNYMSLNAASDGMGRVGDYVIEFIRYIKPSYYTCLLPTILCIILFLWKKDFLVHENWNKKKIFAIILLTLTIHVFSLFTLDISWFQNKNQIKTNKELYQEPTLIELSLRQFGTNRFLGEILCLWFFLRKNKHQLLI